MKGFKLPINVDFSDYLENLTRSCTIYKNTSIPHGILANPTPTSRKDLATSSASGLSSTQDILICIDSSKGQYDTAIANRPIKDFKTQHVDGTASDITYGVTTRDKQDDSTSSNQSGRSSLSPQPTIDSTISFAPSRLEGPQD